MPTKYTATEHPQLPGKYIVKIGHKCRDGGLRYTGDLYASMADALAEANRRQAIAYLNAAAKAIQGVADIEVAKALGTKARSIVDMVQDRIEAEDPLYDPSDPGGWLA